MAARPRYAVDQQPRGRRRELLERTPAGSLVMDVGCWSGFAGRFLLAQGAAAVDGVEPDAEMAAEAALRYRRVLKMPVERALEELLPGDAGAYDVLLFLDVLEHLVEPLEVLATSRALVRPSGRALVSIPNVAHWSVRKELLAGRWRYEDSGLLDRTHLRFFTRASARALIRDAGWKVTWESATLGQPPILRLSESRLEALGRWPSLFGVQLLFEARPR